jgi:hypothetical protein
MSTLDSSPRTSLDGSLGLQFSFNAGAFRSSSHEFWTEIHTFILLNGNNTGDAGVAKIP